MAGLELTLSSGADLSVRRFVSQEAMSQPFTISVWARTKDPAVDLSAIAGQPATFKVQNLGDVGFGGVRTWSGIVSFAQQAQVDPTGLSTYFFRVVPRLWLLTQRKNHRIYQHLTIPQIIDRLLEEWGVEHAWTIDESLYPPLEFKVQWGEPDYTFFVRLLEEAGLSYVFSNDGTSRVILVDTPEKAEPRDGGPIRWVEQPGRAAEISEYVTNVGLGHEVRPGAFKIRDHDYRRPAFALFGEAKPAPAPEDRYEQYLYGPGAMAIDLDLNEGNTPSADDRGWVRHDADYGGERAVRALAGERAGRRAVGFELNFIDLAPGTVFSIVGHPHDELGAKEELLVTELSIECEVQATARVEGRAFFASEPYKPRLATPKPRVRGPHTAIVVGPPGDEISPDEFGRVRVQFPWDREGTSDEFSSCWMHVAQPWGGLGYGFSMLPRVGHEVLVDFIDGDPDRPVVTGRVYNAVQPVPYKLPDNKTISTYKTDSSLGSNGFNEILYEDKAGQELVYLQAERNMAKLVKNDETITVIHDREKHILMQETDTTGLNRTEVTLMNRMQGDGGNRFQWVEGDREKLVKSARTTRTEDVHMRLVGGDHDSVVKGRKRERIDQEVHLKVLGDMREQIDGKQSVHVSEERHEKVKGDMLLEVGSATRFTAAEDAAVMARQSVTLKAGGGFVQIDASGITIVGSTVKINAGGSPGSAPASQPDPPDPPLEAKVDKDLPKQPPRPILLKGKDFKLDIKDHDQSVKKLETNDEVEAKKARYQARKDLIAAGKASSDPKTRAAAERFERNNIAAEKAALSAAVYKDPSLPPPTGWKDISNDPQALAKYGLTPDDLTGSRPGNTRLYEPDPEIFGKDQRPTLVFAGTHSGTDWKNNFQQGVGMESSYYRDAVRLGNTLGNNVDYAGHSLGGGLATAASSAGGGPAWTFNSAGLNPSTVTKYGGTVHPTDVTAYRVDGEVLTGVQEQGWKGTLGTAAAGAGIGALFGGPIGALIGGIAGTLAKVGLSALAPDAIGKKYSLPATSKDPVSRHLMGDVIPGLESQKTEDATLIAGKTGKPLPK